MNWTEEMLTQAKQVQANAHAPYSKFKVGVCIRAEDDSLFSGCNVENAAYPDGLCAEAVAIGQMIASGKTQIKEVVVIGPGEQMCAPCGSCRQKISEFANGDCIIHMGNKQGLLQSVTMEQLLPHSFGPDNLKEN